jgi:hypothetical protein
MTMNKIAARLAKNVVEFMIAGEREKSVACLEILAVIKTKDFVSLRGKVIDNL